MLKTITYYLWDLYVVYQYSVETCVASKILTFKFANPHFSYCKTNSDITAFIGLIVK